MLIMQCIPRLGELVGGWTEEWLHHWIMINYSILPLFIITTNIILHHKWQMDISLSLEWLFYVALWGTLWCGSVKSSLGVRHWCREDNIRLWTTSLYHRRVVFRSKTNWVYLSITSTLYKYLSSHWSILNAQKPFVCPYKYDSCII